MAENSKEQFFAQEVPRIEGRFEERKREYAETQEIKHEREVLHEVLEEHSRQLAAFPAGQASVQSAASQLQSLSLDRQVVALVDLAFEKGLEHAVSAARALNNPHVLDAFHDALADHFYEELVRRGKIQVSI